MGTGIKIENSTNVRVEGNTTIGTDEGIVADHLTDSTIRDNTHVALKATNQNPKKWLSTWWGKLLITAVGGILTGIFLYLAKMN